MEVAKQIVAFHLVDEVNHFFEKGFIDVLNSVGLRVLLISLIKFHFSSISESDVAVDAAHFALAVG